MTPPAARFQLGQHVRVVLNARNQTPHEGTVRQVVWHHEDGCFNYYLLENGKQVSKRYLDDDLLPLDMPPETTP